MRKFITRIKAMQAYNKLIVATWLFMILSIVFRFIRESAAYYMLTLSGVMFYAAGVFFYRKHMENTESSRESTRTKILGMIVGIAMMYCGIDIIADWITKII